jgi:hypothetical protein
MKVSKTEMLLLALMANHSSSSSPGIAPLIEPPPPSWRQSAPTVMSDAKAAASCSLALSTSFVTPIHVAD